MKRRGMLLALLLALGCARRQHAVTQAVSFAPWGEDETTRWTDASIVHVNAVGSEGTAWGLLGTLWLPMGVALAIAVALTARHRRRARLEAASAAGGPLADGPAVVQGVVETDGAEGIVVTLAQQRFTHKDKQGHVHARWDEKQRTVVVRPFHVRLGDGRLVRVEPDAAVLLRDTPDAPEPVDENHRVRRVRLRAGERVWVSGQLSGADAARTAGAYRDGAPTAVLRPGRFERMVVSTEAPGDYDRARAQYHRGWVKGLVVTWALVQGVLLFNVTAQTLSGRAATLRIERVTSWQVWTKPKNRPGRWVRHCAVSGREGPAAPLEEHEVRCTFHECVTRGACRTLPTTRALLTGDALREVGRGPVAHVVQLIFAGIIGWIAALAYWIAATSSRPWYAGGKVSDPG